PKHRGRQSRRTRRTSAQSPAIAAVVRGARRREARAAAPSIGRSAPGNVEYRPGGEGALGRSTERGERSNLLHLDETGSRNLREHVGDVLLRHLRKDRGPGGRGRNAV